MDIAYSRYGLQLPVQAKGNRKSWEEIKRNGAATSLKKRKELIIFVKEKREKLHMAKKDNLYKQLSVYVPKYQRNFIHICEEFVKEKYPGTAFSTFILECISERINSLSREDKKLFEEQAYKLAQKEKPTTTEFVDKFIKNI